MENKQFEQLRFLVECRNKYSELISHNGYEFSRTDISIEVSRPRTNSEVRIIQITPNKYKPEIENAISTAKMIIEAAVRSVYDKLNKDCELVTIKGLDDENNL